MSPPKSTTQDASIFFPDTRFERMARRAGGLTREQAVSGAQKQIEELQSDFGPWLAKQLKDLRIALADLPDGSCFTSRMGDGQRICSQVQDVGATMGYSLVTFVANALYEILETVKAGAPYDKDMVGCHIDALFFVIQEPYRNMSPDDLPELSAGLRRLADIASISPAKDEATGT
jgi:hypothetical protein